MKHLLLLALVLLGQLRAHAQAPVATKKALTLDGAKRVAAAAVAEAVRNQAGGVIAVVDDGGNLMYLERLDGTFAAGATVSTGKARTAVLFQRPTKFFEDVIKNGRTSMVTLPDFTPLQGGVPIVVDGQVVGAVGVSGAKSAMQDEQIALAGAAALLAGDAAACASGCGGAAPAPVTFLDKQVVAAAFALGAPLLETDGYKVHASRREKPGLAEVHALETDVIYVLEGTATFVTGGKLVAPKSVQADEVRGASIEGGESRSLAKGDVIVVPKGTPHWFKDVPGPFTYFVVKVL